MSNDPVFEAWIQKARDTDILAVAQELGAQLKRSGAEHTGPCPRCGGTDRFGVNTNKRVFNCRGSGEKGDVIALVQYVKGCDFNSAVEFITHLPPPRGEGTYKERDPAIEKERREECKEAQREQQAKQRADDEKSIAWAVGVFEAAKPFKGSQAEAYLKKRCLHPTDEQMTDFRFAPKLSYRGYADTAAEVETVLGQYPAMIAAIRNVAGEIIGVHRTFLDPSSPKKLVPPGDDNRNSAKKAGGKVGGGLIRLGPIGRAIAIGEGIETTLSFFALGDGPEDLTIAAAYSLGNISGSATGSMPHPTEPRGTIQNGIPNMDRPGMLLPDHVEDVYLLGDGDKPAMTRARLLTAARRFKALGKNVFVCMAPKDQDFNDVLRDQQKGAA